MSISLPTSELWDLQKPTVPPRSRLFHLPPIGIGTLFVESLMGYVIRLANVHCVPPHQLVFREIAPRMVQNGYFPLNWRNRVKQLFQPNSPLIKGNELEGATTTAFIQALEELTLRQDFAQLSILRQATALFAESQLRSHQSWCPQCLAEWQQDERVLYMPLIWLLKTLEICPQHPRQALIHCCPHCQRSFPPLAETSRIGFCPRCRQWLGVLPWTASQHPCEQNNAEWDSVFADPLEWQLMWLDDSEHLLPQAQQPFYPPKLPGVSDLNLNAPALSNPGTI
jgi:TniQ